MTFAVKTAYIGPYLISLLRGQTNELQKLRYKVPTKNTAVAQGTFVLSGSFIASWSGSPGADHQFGVGSNLTEDRFAPPRQLTLNEDLTLRALSDDSAYICVAGVGLEQLVHIKRMRLAAGTTTSVPRYDLLLVGGADARVRINGSEPKSGARIVYAKTGELEVFAENEVVLGVASFAG